MGAPQHSSFFAPVNAFGAGEVDQLVKDDRLERVVKAGDLAGPQGVATVVHGHLEAVEFGGQGVLEVLYADVAVQDLKHVAAVGFAFIFEAFLGQNGVDLGHQGRVFIHGVDGVLEAAKAALAGL